jgi:acyl-CoA synthetase (AMP-forming)/AMP-acid ligase II
MAQSLAGYKLPKAFIRRDAIARTASGKPDYNWAIAQLA